MFSGRVKSSSSSDSDKRDDDDSRRDITRQDDDYDDDDDDDDEYVLSTEYVIVLSLYPSHCMLYCVRHSCCNDDKLRPFVTFTF